MAGVGLVSAAQGWPGWVGGWVSPPVGEVGRVKAVGHTVQEGAC